VAKLLDMLDKVVVTKLDVLNRKVVELGKLLTDVSISDWSWTRKVVRLVSVSLEVQEADHGGVGNIIGTDVVDTHAVRRGNELLIVTDAWALMNKRSRHHVRCTEDGIRDTRVVGGLLEEIVTGTMELDERNILSVRIVHISSLEEGDLDKVLNTSLLAFVKERREDLSPVVHVWKSTEDGLDALDGVGVTLFVGPIKVNDIRALCPKFL
jgi:hypothetical protein